MTSINTSGKATYIYDQVSQTWYSLAANVNTAASYLWSGSNEFANTVTFDSVVKSKAGINNFATPSARDTAIPSPVRGITCFVKQDATGADINQFQFYDGTQWRTFGDSGYVQSLTQGVTLKASDMGTTITINSSSDSIVIIPLNSSVPFPVGAKIEFIRWGSGAVSFDGPLGGGVTIQSKNGNKKIAARYAGCGIVKVDTNTWALIGDLTA
jgi:hypothetical protein